MDFLEVRTDGLKLSLKLYHPSELQLDCQQLRTEAPPLGDAFPGTESMNESVSAWIPSKARVKPHGSVGFRPILPGLPPDFADGLRCGKVLVSWCRRVSRHSL